MRKKCYIPLSFTMSNQPCHDLPVSACQLAGWAVKNEGNRTRLLEACEIGNEDLLGLSLEVAWLTVDDIRTFHAAKTEVTDPIIRELEDAYSNRRSRGFVYVHPVP